VILSIPKEMRVIGAAIIDEQGVRGGTTNQRDPFPNFRNTELGRSFASLKSPELLKHSAEGRRWIRDVVVER